MLGVIGLVVLLSPLTLQAQVRVTPAEAGINIDDDFRIFRNATSNNLDRNAIMGMRVVMMTELGRYLRQNPTCTQFVTRLNGEMQNTFTRWATSTTAYQGRSWHPINQTFLITPSGTDATHHYGGHMNVMGVARTCSLSTSASNNCGTTVTPRIADYLNIVVSNGRCVAGPPYTPPGVTPIPSQYNIATIDGSKVFPALLPPSDAALEHTHHVHHQASAAVCGDPGASPPPPGAVDQAHQDYEALAPNIDEQHFRRIIDFSGDYDPLWTPAQRCAWKELQNIAHSGPNPTTLFGGQDISWAKQQRTGHTGKSEAAGALHRIYHICLNYKGPYKVSFTTKVIDGAPDFRGPSNKTCEQFLNTPGLMAQLLASHPQHQ
jgi:hypothetical protein